MNDYLREDGSIDLVRLEAEAHRMRAEALAGMVSKLFASLRLAPARGAKTV